MKFILLVITLINNVYAQSYGNGSIVISQEKFYDARMPSWMKDDINHKSHHNNTVKLVTTSYALRDYTMQSIMLNNKTSLK